MKIDCIFIQKKVNALTITFMLKLITSTVKIIT